RVAELVDEDTGLVSPPDMLTFLQRWGPLAWSVLIGHADHELTMFVSSSELAHFRGDPRGGVWAFEFSRPAKLVRDTLAALDGPPESAFRACLAALDRTAPGTLLRALLVQVFRFAISNMRPRRCVGCGQLFVETETPSQAVHRGGWKRR